MSGSSPASVARTATSSRRQVSPPCPAPASAALRAPAAATRSAGGDHDARHRKVSLVMKCLQVAPMRDSQRRMRVRRCSPADADSISRCGEPIAPAARPPRPRADIALAARRISTPGAPSSNHAQRHRRRSPRDSAGTAGTDRPRAARPRCPRLSVEGGDPSRRGPFMSAFTGRPTPPRRRERSQFRAVARCSTGAALVRALAAAGEGFMALEIAADPPAPARAAFCAHSRSRRVAAHAQPLIEENRPTPSRADTPAPVPVAASARCGPPVSRDGRGCVHSRRDMVC